MNLLLFRHFVGVTTMGRIGGIGDRFMRTLDDRKNGFCNRTRSEMAPVEVLGFNHQQLNEFCVGKWGVLTTGLEDFLTRALRIFAKLLNSYRPKSCVTNEATPADLWWYLLSM